ncbi:MAG: TIGR02147 family protein [Chitinispirillaceae bacterium]|nr:TIGR02147 family protein [Chitinispirillaceae bacterium]
MYIIGMAEAIIKPNIYTYFNYREYLSALFNYNKAINPVFSHRYIVTRAGFKSPNSLKNVINGERHISIEGAERFATAFKMEEKERDYFILLVQFTTVKSQKEKERYLSELLKLRKSSLPAGLKDDQMEIMSAWWHVAIREITALPYFKNSSLWISRVLTPPIDHKDAAASLALLKRTGFIKKTESGWRPVEKVMQSDPEVTHVFAARFHREMIRLGMEAIARFSHDLREISSTTLRMSENDVPRVKTLLQNFRRQMLDFAASSQDADQVYQLNFQFFPLVNPDRPNRVKKGKTERI